jgi:hypothetical protein
MARRQEAASVTAPPPPPPTAGLPTANTKKSGSSAPSDGSKRGKGDEKEEEGEEKQQKHEKQENDETSCSTMGLLRMIKARVLDARMTCPISDVPLIIRGFSMLMVPSASTGPTISTSPDREEMKAIGHQILSGYILRVMTVTSALDARQVVRCVQSFTCGEIVHGSLFGQLLSRASDLKATFSVALAVEFVQCAVAVTYDPQTQSACITSAQSVFLFVIGHLLVNDLGGTLCRGRNAELLFGCLEAVAPRDRLVDDVLRSAAQVIKAVPVEGILAALSLIAARAGTDVTAYQTITRHCMHNVLPSANVHVMAQLVLLLVRCGCRGSDLFSRVEARCQYVLKDLDAACVASICDAYQEARYEQNDVVAAIVSNLVPDLASSMSAAQVLSVMSVMMTSRTQHPAANYALFGRITQVMKQLDAVQVTQVLKVAATIRHTRNRKFTSAIADRVSELEAEICSASPMAAVHVAHNLVRIMAQDHPVVTRLLDVAFTNRGALLKRQLLMELVQNIFSSEGVTPDLHPQLHAFAVRGDVIMPDGKIMSLESVAAEAASKKPKETQETKEEKEDADEDGETQQKRDKGETDNDNSAASSPLNAQMNPPRSVFGKLFFGLPSAGRGVSAGVAGVEVPDDRALLQPSAAPQTDSVGLGGGQPPHLSSSSPGKGAGQRLFAAVTSRPRRQQQRQEEEEEEGVGSHDDATTPAATKGPPECSSDAEEAPAAAAAAGMRVATRAVSRRATTSLLSAPPASSTAMTGADGEAREESHPPKPAAAWLLSSSDPSQRSSSGTARRSSSSSASRQHRHEEPGSSAADEENKAPHNAEEAAPPAPMGATRRIARRVQRDNDDE